MADAAHPALTTLQALLPDATVAGGDFAHTLPSPAAVPVLDRPQIFRTARFVAGENCIKDLLKNAGIPDRIIRNGEGGERLWPKEHVGSLTYKKTTVLGALAHSSRLTMLGIDLESIDRDGMALIESTIAPEGLPPGTSSELGVLLAFSAKEAVFKAQYPATTRRLDFSDVRLKWTGSGHAQGDARAACPDGVILGVRFKIVDRWLVSVASADRNI